MEVRISVASDIKVILQPGTARTRQFNIPDHLNEDMQAAFTRLRPHGLFPRQKGSSPLNPSRFGITEESAMMYGVFCLIISTIIFTAQSPLLSPVVWKVCVGVMGYLFLIKLSARTSTSSLTLKWSVK
jgi:hypothetical protein